MHSNVLETQNFWKLNVYGYILHIHRIVYWIEYMMRERKWGTNEIEFEFNNVWINIEYLFQFLLWEQKQPFLV